MVATKLRSGLIGLILLGSLTVPIVLYWAIAWKVLWVVGIILGVGVLYIALLGILTWLDHEWKLDRFGDKVIRCWDHVPKQIRWMLIGIVLGASSPVILALALIAGLLYGITFVYKNYCPLVRESSPQH